MNGLKAVYISLQYYMISARFPSGGILEQTGILDPVEFTIIKGHPQIAYEMLKSIDFDSPVMDIVLQHHEKCNGSGYPYG
jgi:HD-GYP domain-containing protein (c-di-GMP phosphodiesterase class II)